jgi:hypothetical protein
MMPCEWLSGPGGSVIHINYGRGGRKKQCPFCKKGHVEKLCDFPIGHGKTCDAGMCSHCATTLGRQTTDIGSGFKRLNDTKDVCPIHNKGQPVPEAS